MPFAKVFCVMMIDDDPAFLVTLGDALRSLGIANVPKAKSGADEGVVFAMPNAAAPTSVRVIPDRK